LALFGVHGHAADRRKQVPGWVRGESFAQGCIGVRSLGIDSLLFGERAIFALVELLHFTERYAIGVSLVLGGHGVLLAVGGEVNEFEQGGVVLLGGCELDSGFGVVADGVDVDAGLVGGPAEGDVEPFSAGVVGGEHECFAVDRTALGLVTGGSVAVCRMTVLKIRHAAR